MKIIKLITFSVMSVCLLIVPQAWSQGGSAEKQVAALSDQFVQAMAKADTNFMENHLADEFTAIHSDGKLTTKSSGNRQPQVQYSKVGFR